MDVGKFPLRRMRRNRSHGWAREMLAQVRLSASDLILPLFVMEGKDTQEDIVSLPGVKRLTIDGIVSKAQEAKALGIQAVALFPKIDIALKTTAAEESYNENNLICRTVQAIKTKVPDIGVICDVALDPYTIHGHDGIVKNEMIVNDETVEILCRQAQALAKAGCDIVAPSDMMDGRVGAIRAALDQASYTDVKILAYAVKYASHLYRPFRDAVGSSSALGKADKKTYQMDFRNKDEAILEAALDVKEGADLLMVKPATLYLDIIATLKQHFHVPILAYHVSGEYAMIKAADEKGWIDSSGVLMELLIACKRAGASAIFTYGACEVAALLKNNERGDL